MIFSLGDRRLKTAGDDYFIAETSSVIGSVEMGEWASVWFGCVLRGDDELIRLGARTNVQDGSVLHVAEGEPCLLGDQVTVGHMCMLHSVTIGDNSLIGNGAMLLDNVRVGKNVVIAANSLIPPGKVIPDGVVVMGSPYRIVRDVTDKDFRLIEVGWRHYVENAKRFRRDLVREG